jgi:uncharacterized protein
VAHANIAPSGHLRAADWGARQVALGITLALLCLLFTGGLLVALTSVFGSDYQLDDVGDSFAKLDAVAKYADERLVAATNGQPLPGPPRILADLMTVKLGLATTLLYESLLVTVVGGSTQQTLPGLLRALGLDRFDVAGLWRPGLAVIACYLGVAGYVLLVQALGIDFLTPNPTVPDAITRDAGAAAVGWVLAVIAAPLSEELFFRGFMFGGLLRWGFWPAAALSAGAFTLAHLDPGSIIPFFGIGLVMAWLYWRRGSLWDSIAFHCIFNFISFALLLART